MTSPKPFLTIAVPTYNRAHKVSQLAHSILSQMEEGEELLIVDDGSPDNTSEVLNAIAGVRVHRHDPNQGMVKTWNACLRLAANEWICIIHDDDIVCEGALEGIRQACRAIGEPALLIHKPGVQTSIYPFAYHLFSPGPSAVFCSATGTVPSGAVIHKDIVDSLGGFDEELRYSSDIEYFARINARYKLLVIEAPKIVEYQVHNDNYQYKTWLEADFFPQLQKIEKSVISYSGLEGSEASAQLNSRLVNYLIYITQRSAQIKNKALMHKYGLLLWQAQGCQRRLRAKGLATALKSKLPFS